MSLKAKRHCTENPEVVWVLVSLPWCRQQSLPAARGCKTIFLTSVIWYLLPPPHTSGKLSVFTWSVNTAVHLSGVQKNAYLPPPEANTSLHLHCSAPEQSWESSTHCPDKLYPYCCIQPAACQDFFVIFPLCYTQASKHMKDKGLRSLTWSYRNHKKPQQKGKDFLLPSCFLMPSTHLISILFTSWNFKNEWPY